MVFTFVSSAEGPALYFHMNQLPFTMSLGLQHLTAQRNYHAFTFYFIKMKDLDFSLFLPAKQDLHASEKIGSCKLRDCV